MRKRTIKGAALLAIVGTTIGWSGCLSGVTWKRAAWEVGSYGLLEFLTDYENGIIDVWGEQPCCEEDAAVGG